MVSARNIIYSAGFALFAAILAYPIALRFEPSSMLQQVLGAAAFFSYSAFLSFLYLQYAPPKGKFNPLLGGLTAVFTSAVVFSVVRGNITLLPTASLFALPGSLIGSLFPCRTRSLTK